MLTHKTRGIIKTITVCYLYTCTIAVATFGSLATLFFSYNDYVYGKLVIVSFIAIAVPMVITAIYEWSK